MRKDTSVLLATLGLCLVLLVGFSLYRSLPGRLPWIQSYQQALKQAQQEGKLVLAYLYTDWCGYCKKMEAETFTDQTVIDEMSDSYVWLKLNAETDREGRQLQERFNITGYPGLLLLDGDGQEMERISGFVPAEAFRQRVAAAAGGPDSFVSLLRTASREPDSIDVQYRLAEEYIERGDFSAAIERLRRVIELDPENSSGKADLSYYYLALSLASQGNEELALVELDSLQSSFPGSDYIADSTFLRGQIHYHSGNRDQAEKVLAAYVQDYPEHIHVSKARDILAEREEAE
ncbi:MAG: thioredoxin fold domain-containing protein [Candidatus Aminicenantes bacterium]|nr:thioredoxin fold domain-containing protein [Candidatus Aminicenantes bacterium]